MLDKSQTLAINKLISFIEEFRKLDPEMPLQMAQTFLFVSTKPDDNLASVKDVADHLGVSQASASRNVMALTDVSRHRRDGHDLLRTFENPVNRTQKLIEVTPKGKRVLSTIFKIMGA